MTQVRTWDDRSPQDTNVLNRRWLRLTSPGVYDGYDVTATAPPSMNLNIS